MSTPQHEDRAMHQFMDAPLAVQAAQLREWGERPVGLLILMSACEGRCFFCAQPAVITPPSEMFTLWPAVESKIRANQSLGLNTLLIGGTEPPTHPDFERTLRLAKDCGFQSIQLMTSALRLSHQSALWWSLGVRSVCSPLYSMDAATHDGIVGVSGHWGRVVAGLDSAKAQGMELFIHTLAMRRTLQEVPDLAVWVRKRWGRPLALAPMRPKERLFPYSEEAPSLEAVRSVRDEVDLVGFPLCVGESGNGALLTRLYFRGQARSYGEICHLCTKRPDCGGVVQGHLEAMGGADLTPL